MNTNADILKNLPVQQLKARFLKAHQHGNTVVVAPTGSGKSTLVPLWCAEVGQRTLVVEPRRVACCSLARFVSQTIGSPLGHTVGYAVRHEDRIGDKTRVAFVTPGDDFELRTCRITANHFALIRSFLIESDVFRRLRAPSVQKFSFCRRACFKCRQRKT